MVEGWAQRAAVIGFGAYRLDWANAQLWHGATLVALRPKAMDLLTYLAKRPQQLVSKQELLNALWGNARVSDGVLKTQVKELRQALGDAAQEPRFIETVHRRGYRFLGSRVEGVICIDETTGKDTAAANDLGDAMAADLMILSMG